jgi:hypothetical protein
MEKLSNLPNIGAELEKKLISAGIRTPDDLINSGAEDAFLKIRLSDHSACFNMLMALEGAVQGIRWHDLSAQRKKELKQFLKLRNIPLTPLHPKSVKLISLLFLFVIFSIHCLAQDVTFTQVTQGNIVNDGGWCYGMCWSDINQDDLPDLFVTNNDANNGKLNFLYINNGDGTFEKVTEGPVVTDGGSSYACSFADINNDSYPDLFVANHNENNFLYLNDGFGVFTKVTAGDIVNNGGKSVGCAWTDYDLDTWPDLYVANRDQQNFLYHGTGFGEFEKITVGSIVTDVANSSGCAWGDYDNDGFPDLYVANSGTVSNLYHNNGDGTFSKVSDDPFISDVSSCSGASWGDCDNDGDLDLFVSTGQLGMYPNWFYLNNGDGTFTKIIDSTLVNDATWSSGSAWGDYDKDGDPDLAVGGYDGNNQLFSNDGYGNFEKVLNNAFVNAGNYTEGLGWADADNDGDLDIFTARNNYFGGNNAFSLNDGNENNWLKIELAGFNAGGYFQPIGAKVYVTATINGNDVTQMQELSAQTGGGQAGQNEPVLFFGMGNAAFASIVSVHWNFHTFESFNFAANQTHQVLILLEGENEWTSPIPQKISIYPNPASTEVNIGFNLTQLSEVNVLVKDVYGRCISNIPLGLFGQGHQSIHIGNLGDQFPTVGPGTYFIQLKAGNHWMTEKIIIQ